MEQDGLDTVEPTAQAEEAWRQRIVDTSSGSLFAETDSWWVGTNIPGRKKEMMIYAYGIHQYEQECRATLDDWKGFDVRKQASLCSPVHGRLGAA